MSGDVMRLKRSVDLLGRLAEEQYPHWEPFQRVAAGDYERLRGNAERALSE